MRTLLASPNVDVNGVDEYGNTSLIEAARFGHDEVVTALLTAKADAKIKNDENKTSPDVGRSWKVTKTHHNESIVN